MPAGEKDHSLLAALLHDASRAGHYAVNFDDLTGILRAHSSLHLPEELQIHSCSFCQLAKKDGFAACLANKKTVNRLVINQRGARRGMCHLGLTDCVQPVIVQGHLLGVLFYGGVVEKAREQQSRQKLERGLLRHKAAAGELLEVWKRIPRLAESELQQMEARLRMLAELLEKMILACGIPVERFMAQREHLTAKEVRQHPPVVQRAMALIARRFREPLNRNSIAQDLRCNPSWLSETFKASSGLGVREYLTSVRVAHAKKLLASGLYNVSECASACGFEDVSHFGRVFRKQTGLSPGKWIPTDEKTKI